MEDEDLMTSTELRQSKNSRNQYRN